MLARAAAMAALLLVLLGAGMLPLLAPPSLGPASSADLWPLTTDRIPLVHADSALPLAASLPIQMTLTLQPRSAESLAAFDRAVADPASPAYRQYLTEPEFEARYSPSPSNVSAVVSYFSGFGARDLCVSPDRLGVSFVLPAGGAGRAFGTELVSLSGPHGETLRTTGSLPSLPRAVAGKVASVGGLGGLVRPVMHRAIGPLAMGPAGAGSSPTSFLNGSGAASRSQWFVGSDFAQAYHENALFPGGGAANATFPTNQAVATLLMSSYNDSLARDLPPWDPTQVDAYFNQTLAPTWPHPVVQGVPVSIANVTPPAPGSLGFSNDSSHNEEENSLDLEMAGSTAPGAELVNFYFAESLFEKNSSSATYGTLADDFGLALASALSHNYSPSRLAAVSGSFGLPDLNDSLWNTELAHAAAVGVTVIASSGDQANAPDDVSGRSDGAWPSWPASAAFSASGVVAVGGVSVAVSGAATGTFNGVGSPLAAYDPAVTGVASERAWYDTLAGPGNISGTEGGISLKFPEPAWQFHSAAQPGIAAASGVQGVLALGRAEPDVSFPANATIAFVRTAPGGTVETALLEGTSVGAPLFAGLVAEWAAVARHPFGYIDPELYRIAGYFSAHPGAEDPFLDVTAGNNYVFAAAPGWDATTGWGGIDAVRFLRADANATIQGYVYNGPTPGLPPRSGSPGSTNLLLSIPIGLTLAGVIVVWIALERRSPTAINARPPPYVPPAGAPEGSWFACPYCGAPRPSEPTRCPGCGRF